MTIDAWILFFIFLLETKDVLIVEKKKYMRRMMDAPPKIQENYKVCLNVFTMQGELYTKL